MCIRDSIRVTTTSTSSTSAIPTKANFIGNVIPSGLAFSEKMCIRDRRWVELYELQINGGAYMTTESNRDIISETAEEAGKIPSLSLIHI